MGPNYSVVVATWFDCNIDLHDQKVNNISFQVVGQSLLRVVLCALRLGTPNTTPVARN